MLHGGRLKAFVPRLNAGEGIMSRSVRWGVLFLLAVLAVGIAYGQIRSATITGTVTDASGGVIAGAQVTVTEQQTAISNTTKTTEAGVFTVPYLPAGTYTVAITAQGFADYRLTGASLVTTGRRPVGCSTQGGHGRHDRGGRGSGGSRSRRTAARSRGAISTPRRSTSCPIPPPIRCITRSCKRAWCRACTTADTTTIESFGIGVHGRKAVDCGWH